MDVVVDVVVGCTVVVVGLTLVVDVDVDEVELDEELVVEEPLLEPPLVVVVVVLLVVALLPPVPTSAKKVRVGVWMLVCVIAHKVGVILPT